MWGSALKTHLHILEVTQRRFIKFIYSKSARYPSNQLYTEAKMLDLRQLYFLSVCIRYHTHKHSSKLPTHSYDTRQGQYFVVPFMTKTVSQRSYSYLAPKLYNTIPQDLKKILNIHRFKKHLKQYIIGNNRVNIRSFFET